MLLNVDKWYYYYYYDLTQPAENGFPQASRDKVLGEITTPKITCEREREKMVPHTYLY